MCYIPLVLLCMQPLIFHIDLETLQIWWQCTICLFHQHRCLNSYHMIVWEIIYHTISVVDNPPLHKHIDMKSPCYQTCFYL
jgi:hypothetical protein